MSREIAILTPEHVELKFELAGLGSRFFAIFLDSLTQSLFVVVVGIVLVSISYVEHLNAALSREFDQMSPWFIAFILLLLFSLWTGYFLYFEIAENGQTPGKKWAGIRVIRDSGHPVDFRAALLRNLMRSVDVLPVCYIVGAISIFASPQCRRLGDYVGGTLVVKTRSKQERPQAPETLTDTVNPAQPAGYYLPDEALACLSSVTKEDYRAVRHFLDRRWDLQPTVATSLALKLVKPLAVKVQIDPETIGNPVEFLEGLTSDWERRMVH